MYKILSHPILPIPNEEKVSFYFADTLIEAQKGITVAAALHQSGYQVHSESLDHRKRTMECGIGKCGACEMLVDGKIKRICITKVDDVKKVERISDDYGFKGMIEEKVDGKLTYKKIYKTSVLIIGAGPAGLSVRESLNEENVDNIVVDNNSHIGGQFLMQTHQFFFFEKEKRFGGMRGFDIANSLVGTSPENIFLDSVVWDILEGKRAALKNIRTEEIFYIDADELVIATGALPFMPAFKNDDVPGVYTAAVIQRMMNTELTLLGKNILTVGAGNIGYLTSYQAMQAGANVKAILEAMPREGGFPVQANRLRRLGIPIMTSHMLLEAIPNDDYTGVVGAIVAECENFKPIPGTEKRIDGIDCINICTGLLPDNQLFIKGNAVYGRSCHGVGDSVRIGEGTSAVLRGKQCAYEIMQNLGKRINYEKYLEVSKEYLESQQHPVRVLEHPNMPSKERMEARPFVIADCLYGFACNPCSFACKYGAITKASTSVAPSIDYEKCTGCMRCVTQCPGLAMFGYDLAKSTLFLPIEYDVKEGAEVYLVDNNGTKLGEAVVEKVITKSNKTNLARVKSIDLLGGNLVQARGFIVKENYPQPLQISKIDQTDAKSYICHCEDLTLEKLLELIGDRKSITADELKHISRLGMGACRGNRCLPRAKSALRAYGIDIIGDFTPRGPMSNLIEMGGVINENSNYKYFTPKNSTRPIERVDAIVAGGGMAGTSVLRYLAESGMKPLLLNNSRGSSWRNIAGGRPAFSMPALADIAYHNRDIFMDLAKLRDIDYHAIRYVSFAHDKDTYEALEQSKSWSDAFMVEAKDFRKEISEHFNPNISTYTHALVTNDCWQVNPGKSIDLIRDLAIAKGATIKESAELLFVEKLRNEYRVLVKNYDDTYSEYLTPIFVNALGPNADKFAKQLGLDTGLFPVKHQAFITKRLPLIGKDGACLDMLIDRRKYKGFSAVYGQQLTDTGQIIGCASPVIDAKEANSDLRFNSNEFIEIVSEVFSDWIPALKDVGFQALWSGYYVEPRYIVDPANGLFIGMRGHGLMLSQYFGKLYVDSLMGREVPEYFKDLALKGPGIAEQSFK